MHYRGLSIYIYIYAYVYILYPTLSIWIRELSILFRSTALRLRRALGASRGELKSSSKMLPELSSQTLKRGLQGLLWDSEDSEAGNWWWWWWWWWREMKRKQRWNGMNLRDLVNGFSMERYWMNGFCDTVASCDQRKRSGRSLTQSDWLVVQTLGINPLSAKLFVRFQGRFQDWFCSFDGSCNLWSRIIQSQTVTQKTDSRVPRWCSKTVSWSVLFLVLAVYSHWRVTHLWCNGIT